VLAQEESDALECMRALEECRSQLVPAGEGSVVGWVVVSINKWGQEQERVVLLSEQAYSRPLSSIYGNNPYSPRVCSPPLLPEQAYRLQRHPIISIAHPLPIPLKTVDVYTVTRLEPRVCLSFLRVPL